MITILANIHDLLDLPENAEIKAVIIQALFEFNEEEYKELEDEVNRRISELPFLRFLYAALSPINQGNK